MAGHERVFGFGLPSWLKLADIYAGIGVVAVLQVYQMAFRGNPLATIAFDTYGGFAIISPMSALRVILVLIAAGIIGRTATSWIHGIEMFSSSK